MTEDILSRQLTIEHNLFFLGCYPKENNKKEERDDPFGSMFVIGKTDDGTIMEKCK